MKSALLLITLLSIFTPAAQAICIIGDNVNLRTKPDPKAKVSWIVGRNMPLLPIEKKGAWLQVKDFEGTRHWVHMRNVTNNMSCVVVRARIANLRTGPGAKFGQTDLGYVKKYSTFKKIGRDEEWIKVQDNFGEVHWVNETAMWEPRNYSHITF